MSEILMPRLSDSMEEGTIVRWLKSSGDEVGVGEEIVEIETDKATMTFEAEVQGVLTILAAEGDVVALGEAIARISDGAEASDAVDPKAQRGDARAATAIEEPPRAQATTGREHRQLASRSKASPLARRVAADLGIDLATLTGSGVDGRIVKTDVEKAAGSPTSENGGRVPAPAAGTAVGSAFGSTETAKGTVAVEELSRLQQVVARRMSESKATAPHFYLEAEIDMSNAVEARRRLKMIAAEGELVPSFNDMVVKACALALRDHPRANGAYRDGRFELHARVNVGIAVPGQDALVVPVIVDADQKGLHQIAADARALAVKVRDNSITPPELSGGTFTVSNLGMYGIDSFSAVINTPQAAILAVGAIKERAVVRGGQLVAAHMLRVTLSCDHRILYGAPAAEFLARVRALLEEPLSLAL
jgi:pyruvate dehydrogenase E2 component (dihydrolipoamide acetyltransferase)